MENPQLLSPIQLRTRHSVQDFKELKQRKDTRVRKCNFQWTSEATMLLIQNVEKYENLWNSSYFSYKNRKTHQKSWEKIAKALYLPKQEVVVKWNSLRSNYRIYLKNRRCTSTSGKQRTPHRFFVAMAFLDPVLNIDVKGHESNLQKYESSKNTIPRSSSFFKDLDLDRKDSNQINIFQIKEETVSPFSPNDSPLLNQLEETTSQQESGPRPPILLCKKKYKKRKMHKQQDQQKDTEEDLESLERTKLRLQIYNLQLDAVKKEIDLGLERSRFTAELYKNWDR